MIGDELKDFDFFLENENRCSKKIFEEKKREYDILNFREKLKENKKNKVNFKENITNGIGEEKKLFKNNCCLVKLPFLVNTKNVIKNRSVNLTNAEKLNKYLF